MYGFLKVFSRFSPLPVAKACLSTAAAKRCPAWFLQYLVAPTLKNASQNEQFYLIPYT